MVSAEIFGLHPAMSEKNPEDHESSRNSNKSSTSKPEDLTFSHPFNGESSARVPIVLYPLARRVGFSTIVLSSLLYAITIVPALLAVSGYDPFGGSGLIPLALPILIGTFAGRRKRRSLENEIPLEKLNIDLDKIRSLIATLESPFGVTINNGNNLCSKFRLCRRIESFRQSLVKFLRYLFTSQLKHYQSSDNNHIQALPKFPNS